MLEEIKERNYKHLELIQGVINRLSTHSVIVKGWSIILLSAVFAFSPVDINGSAFFNPYIAVGLFSAIFVFLMVDSIYLHQEQQYHDLYNYVRTLEGKDLNFTMDTTLSKKDRKSLRKWGFSQPFRPFMLFMLHLLFYAILLLVISWRILAVE